MIATWPGSLHDVDRMAPQGIRPDNHGRFYRVIFGSAQSCYLGDLYLLDRHDSVLL